MYYKIQFNNGNLIRGALIDWDQSTGKGATEIEGNSWKKYEGHEQIQLSWTFCE